MSKNRTHSEIIDAIRLKCARAYWSEDSLHPNGDIPEIKCLEPHKLATLLEAAHKREVDALKQRLAELDAKIVAKDEVLKRCAAFLGETIQCGVEGEMLDGRHVNVAASDLADDIDDLLKQRTEASHPEGREG